MTMSTMSGHGQYINKFLCNAYIKTETINLPNQPFLPVNLHMVDTTCEMPLPPPCWLWSSIADGE